MSFFSFATLGSLHLCTKRQRKATGSLRPKETNNRGEFIMSSSDETAWLDATDLAELVRKMEVKPIELVDAAIERIERVNSQLNAVITPMFDQARAAAKGKLPDGPFTGVPFLLKDLLAAYAGVPMTSGSAFTRALVP